MAYIGQSRGRGILIPGSSGGEPKVQIGIQLCASQREKMTGDLLQFEQVFARDLDGSANTWKDQRMEERFTHCMILFCTSIGRSDSWRVDFED